MRKKLSGTDFEITISFSSNFLQESVLLNHLKQLPIFAQKLPVQASLVKKCVYQRI